MNRVFISLYIVIVASIVLLGWGADKLMQMYNPEPQLSNLEAMFLSEIEDRLQSPDYRKKSEAELNSLVASGRYETECCLISIHDLDVLADSSLATAVRQGEVQIVYNAVGHKVIYKRVAMTRSLIQIQVSEPQPHQSPIYFAMLVVFYLIIAIVIYFWIWPLSRDLKILQRRTHELGDDGVPKAVSLSARSAVLDLAKSFNAMSERIRALISSHKEMTSAVSHELRTPLARMRFAAEIAEAQASEGVQKQINSIKLDIDEMDALINGLLSYAGFEQYSQALDYQTGDLGSMIDKVLRRNCQGGSIECEFNNQLDGMQVSCEWRLLEHCVHNLIQNANRYTQSKVMITALVENDAVVVCVDDDGAGVAPADRVKILQPFVRLPNQNKKSGFGLGLAIVNRIIQWHKGEVIVSESPMGGARFQLKWPLAR